MSVGVLCLLAVIEMAIWYAIHHPAREGITLAGKRNPNHRGARARGAVRGARMRVR